MDRYYSCEAASRWVLRALPCLMQHPWGQVSTRPAALRSRTPHRYSIDPPHEILPLHIHVMLVNNSTIPDDRCARRVAKTQLSLAHVHMKLVAVQLRTWSGSVGRWPCATRNGVSIDQSAACSCVAHDFASDLASSGISAVEQIGRRSPSSAEMVQQPRRKQRSCSLML